MLAEKYQKEVIQEMMKLHGYTSVMAVPKIEKIVVNTGFGRLAVSNAKDAQRKFEELVQSDLAAITGQKPLMTRAKKSISSFKIRQGMVIGAKVTLRGQRMYGLLEKLLYVALPRTRDFKGVSPDSIDKTGNLTLGLKEHVVFPEIIQDKEKQVFGLEFIIQTSAKNKKEAFDLLRLMGVPFKK